MNNPTECTAIVRSSTVVNDAKPVETIENHAPPQVEPDGKTMNAQFKGSVAARGLVQTFGLDIRAAVLTVIVDLMVFGGNIISFGALIVVGCIAAAVLAHIVYEIQVHWYGDDHESAKIKAMIVGLLTAIPVPLTPLIAVPCGIIGLARIFQKR